MSDLNPYQADPYRQGTAGSQPYFAGSDMASHVDSGASSAPGGYYSTDYPGGQSYPFPVVSGNQMAPYPEAGRQPDSQVYGPPYHQQYPYPSYPSAPYGPYPPYGPGASWGAFYDPRRHEANTLGGWALGLGIASIFMNCLYLGAVPGVPAIIVGINGMRAADEGRASNKGLSIAGVVMGAIGSVISACFFMLFVMVIFNDL